MLEDELVGPGDDALLERLETFKRLTKDDPRVRATGGFDARVFDLHQQTGELAEAFLRRRLFKVAGRVGIKDAPARELYEKFHDARARSELERDAERFAGLKGGPQVLIWLPNPKMRQKVADVLADDGEHIDRSAAYEAPRSGRGADIYGGHSRVWALWVFTHPVMDNHQEEEVLAYLAERLGVPWEREVRHWGPEYWQWVDRLILSRVLETDAQESTVEDLLKEVAASVPPGLQPKPMRTANAVSIAEATSRRR